MPQCFRNRFAIGESTGAFRVAPGALTAVIGRRWLSGWWPALAVLPLGLILYGAVADLRWVLVGIAVLFLLLPPAFLFLLLAYALRPSARYSVALHTITPTDDGLLFHRITPMSPLRPQRCSPALPLRPLRGSYLTEELIPYPRITAISHTERYTILTLDNSPYKPILIPRTQAEGIMQIGDGAGPAK